MKPVLLTLRSRSPPRTKLFTSFILDKGLMKSGLSS